MEDDGFDPLGHEVNYGGSHHGHDVNHGIDLNSQASAATDGFSGMRPYRSFLQRDDVDLNPISNHDRRLNFGSSSAAPGAGVPAGRSRGDGGTTAQQHASTVPELPPRRAARTAGGSQRGRRPPCSEECWPWASTQHQQSLKQLRRNGGRGGGVSELRQSPSEPRPSSSMV
ncbi:unnamed protein product [Urochloa humidicola]